MNRPNIKDYGYLKETVEQFNTFKYSQDMETYCDKLEKAVDKLAGVLQATSGFYIKDAMLQSHRNMVHEWKEWALKDE